MHGVSDLVVTLEKSLSSAAVRHELGQDYIICVFPAIAGTCAGGMRSCCWPPCSVSNTQIKHSAVCTGCKLQCKLHSTVCTSLHPNQVKAQGNHLSEKARPKGSQRSRTRTVAPQATVTITSALQMCCSQSSRQLESQIPKQANASAVTLLPARRQGQSQKDLSHTAPAGDLSKTLSDCIARPKPSC